MNRKLLMTPLIAAAAASFSLPALADGAMGRLGDSARSASFSNDNGGLQRLISFERNEDGMLSRTAQSVFTDRDGNVVGGAVNRLSAEDGALRRTVTTARDSSRDLPGLGDGDGMLNRTVQRTRDTLTNLGDGSRDRDRQNGLSASTELTLGALGTTKVEVMRGSILEVSNDR